jgi:hypothetical protein
MTARKQSNDVRSLDEIAADLRRVESNSLFERGDLLLEAKKAHPNEFLDWLYDEFEYSEDTAERYMRVARLDSAILRNLHLGRTTLYDLCDEDDEALPVIIAELAKHATKAHLKPAKARDIILIGRSRFFHGNHPDATLWALAGLDAEGYTHSIRAAAVAALKAQNPETDEAADNIIADVRRADVAKQWAPYGELPDIPCDALRFLNVEDIREDRRTEVLRRLREAPQPLTEDQVHGIVYGGGEDAGDDEDDKSEAKEMAAPRSVKPQSMPGQIGPMFLPPSEPEPTKTEPTKEPVKRDKGSALTYTMAQAQLAHTTCIVDILDQLGAEQEFEFVSWAHTNLDQISAKRVKPAAGGNTDASVADDRVADDGLGIPESLRRH